MSNDENSSTPEREVPVDLRELCDLYAETAGTEHEMPFEIYLDLKTGDVVHIIPLERLAEDEEEEELGFGSLISSGVDVDEEDWELARLLDAEPHRFLELPTRDHWEPYQDMVAFIRTIENALLQARLEAAIQGKGAFGRFKAIIQERENLEKEWFTFRDARIEEEVRQWLWSENIRVVPRVQKP